MRYPCYIWFITEQISEHGVVLNKIRSMDLGFVIFVFSRDDKTLHLVWFAKI